jgi:hypothetical protein
MARVSECLDGLRWNGRLFLGLVRDKDLRFYAGLCVGVLGDMLVGREVHFEMNCKQPGPDVLSLGPRREGRKPDVESFAF